MLLIAYLNSESLYSGDKLSVTATISELVECQDNNLIKNYGDYRQSFSSVIYVFIYLCICADSTAQQPVPKTAQVLGDSDKKLRLAKPEQKKKEVLK